MDYCKNNSRKKIIIAIDGYSACGKSTFAKDISARIGYIFIDTGAMYRAVTLYAINHGMIKNGKVDEQTLIAALPDIKIAFKFNPDRGASDIYLNGHNVEKEIRGIEVSDAVSLVSQIGEVRSGLVRLQQQMGVDKGIVMDGRDIGTVVFPNAELKIFMTASEEVRVERRYKELLSKGENVSKKEIAENLRARDYADEHRAISPLRKADDAILLDNSDMTPADQMKWIMGILDKLTCM